MKGGGGVALIEECDIDGGMVPEAEAFKVYAPYGLRGKHDGIVFQKNKVRAVRAAAVIETDNIPYLMRCVSHFIDCMSSFSCPMCLQMVQP